MQAYPAKPSRGGTSLSGERGVAVMLSTLPHLSH